jgi:hypothetical protein
MSANFTNYTKAKTRFIQAKIAFAQICVISGSFPNCLRQNAMWQFDSVVKDYKTMSYAKTGECNCPKTSRLVGGQIPAKTAGQISRKQGIFASIFPVRPICPFAPQILDGQRAKSLCPSLLPRRLCRADLSTIASERRWKAEA